MSGSVGCVVVAFHRPESLRRLLSRLDHPDLTVTVVNVEGDPEVSSAVGEARAAEIFASNDGYAAAVNLGVAHLYTQAVVFLNDDVVAEAETIVALGRRALESGNVIIPSLTDGEGSPEGTLQPFPSARALLVEWALLPDRPPRRATGRFIRKWRTPTQPVRIEAAAATVVACPRDVLREVPLPEDYFLYWEDSAWFWQLRQAGIEAEFAPDLAVRHSGGRADVRPEKSALLARNAVRCVRRTRGLLPAAAAVPIVILWNLRLLAQDLVRAATSRAARRRLRSRAAGLRAAVGSWRELR